MGTRSYSFVPARIPEWLENIYKSKRNKDTPRLAFIIIKGKGWGGGGEGGGHRRATLPSNVVLGPRFPNGRMYFHLCSFSLFFFFFLSGGGGECVLRPTIHKRRGSKECLLSSPPSSFPTPPSSSSSSSSAWQAHKMKHMRI